jgi:type IV pilus assembly protein PilY1
MTARTHRLRRSPRLLAPGLAFLATLISLPGAAVNVPDVPLQSGAAYPPANIRFILDDSGSMEWDFMPGASSAAESRPTSPVDVKLNAYTRNTLSYNPSITYQPWIKADNTRYTTGRRTRARTATTACRPADDQPGRAAAPRARSTRRRKARRTWRRLQSY